MARDAPGPASTTTFPRGAQGRLRAAIAVIAILVYGTELSKNLAGLSSGYRGTFAAMVNSAMQISPPNGLESGQKSAILAALGARSVVLVGMMGAGKSSVGRRLAARLGLAFADADGEIESAAAMTIPEMFAKHGEAYFRAGEARVIARLLDGGPRVLATGGGAVMDAQTRALIRDKGVSVWLKADPELLLKRTKRRDNRPLAGKIMELLPVREPIYALADIVVQSRDEPHDLIIDEIMQGIALHLGVGAESSP